MDKGWMFKHRLSKEYEAGVTSFLNFAIENCKNPNAMSCPCVKCGNLRENDVKTIKAHLTYNGMDLTYRSWILHGERYRDYTSDKHVGNTMCSDSHPAEPIDMEHDAYVDNPADFQNLLEDAEMALYPRCVKFTKLSATVKLYNLKTKYGWSDTSFTDLLMMIREMLPEENVLPSSLYEAKKSLSMLGMKYEKIHACPKDCILYRNEHANLVSCPTCGNSRWKMLKNDQINEGVPAKVLWYFPPIPRFQRMFRNKDMSNNLRWHAHKRVRDGHLRHPADAPAWELVDQRWPDFGMEPRNLRLALSADGMNPHGVMSSKYSCWPIILITYNLPPWLCLKRRHMMLTLLVSGPHQPGNDIDVYLAPLIDDLKKLWELGVESYDAYSEEKFMLIEKNVCESLFGTLLNIPGKTKDGVKARLDLVDMGLRDELAPRVGEKRTYLPPVCYSLSKEEKRQVCAFFSRVKVPTGYSSNLSSLLSTDDTKLVGLKSHDCHTLMQQLLPVALRGVLPKQVRYDITRLCFFFNVLCNKVVDVSKLDDIERDIIVTLCLLEKHFPPAFFDIMVHLIVHLVREVRLCGPVWFRWMYPFERFMRVLKDYQLAIDNHRYGIWSWTNTSICSCCIVQAVEGILQRATRSIPIPYLPQTRIH